MPNGIMISVNFYHKLVTQGKVEHQAELTLEQMKSIADRLAGAPPPPPPSPPPLPPPATPPATPHRTACRIACPRALPKATFP